MKHSFNHNDYIRKLDYVLLSRYISLLFCISCTDFYRWSVLKQKSKSVSIINNAMLVFCRLYSVSKQMGSSHTCVSLLIDFQCAVPNSFWIQHWCCLSKNYIIYSDVNDIFNLICHYFSFFKSNREMNWTDLQQY